MLFGGRAFGKYGGQEGEAHMNGFSGLTGDMRKMISFSLCHVRYIKKVPMDEKEGPHQTIALIFGLSSFQNSEK